MAEFNTNLWAPWRMEYIRDLGPDLTEDGCFLCRYWSNPVDDSINHVAWRGASSFVALNRFPYTNGHTLVAHASHKADLTDLNDADLSEMMRTIRDVVAVLRRTLDPQGFNIGFNLGRCAGAGLPGHLHAHVVPRWNGDTNFMAVVGDVRVVPESLDKLYSQIIRAAMDLGLRH